jgi:hypothetical protein
MLFNRDPPLWPCWYIDLVRRSRRATLEYRCTKVVKHGSMRPEAALKNSTLCRVFGFGLLCCVRECAVRVCWGGPGGSKSFRNLHTHTRRHTS